MTSDDTSDGAGGRSPDALLLWSCAAIGFAGSALLLVGNIVGSLVVPGHDWVADTVSDLAAGKYESIQDVALYGYAAALLACAIGTAHVHAGSRRWSIGILSMTVMALLITVIAARNEYGDDDSEGIVIHIYLVYALMTLFLATALVMARDLGRVRPFLATVSYACAAFWIIGGPVFFFMPTGYDGAWERLLGLVTIVWVCSVSWMLLAVRNDRRGRIFD